jgi:hypothetical protein
VIARTPTNMDVFYRDSAGDLVNDGWDANSGWTGPIVRVTGSVASDPAAVGRGSGDMDVFYRDTSGRLGDAGWNSTRGWGQFSP